MCALSSQLYATFISSQLPPHDKKYMSALWGKLASEILMQNWEHAMDDLMRLKEVIDSNVCNAVSLDCAV